MKLEEAWNIIRCFAEAVILPLEGHARTAEVWEALELVNEKKVGPSVRGNYMDIPEHIRHSMMLYVTQGLRPGKAAKSWSG